MKNFGRCLFCFFSFFSINALADGFSENMNVKIGVFDASDVKIEYDRNANKYNIKAEVKTANLFGGIYPFFGQYEATGYIIKNKVKPIIYKTKTTSRNHVRTKSIFYNEKGIAYKRISTKDDKKNEVDIKNVPNSANAGDMQTIFAEMIDKFIKNRSCALVREVYDGKKHYRIIAEDKGVENRWFSYMQKSQNAYKCSIYIENLKQNNDNILWDVSAETPIYLWIEMDKKTKMPKILEIRIDSTPLGALQVTPSDL